MNQTSIENFWKMHREGVEFIIRHHRELVDDVGEEGANEQFAEGITASEAVLRLAESIGGGLSPADIQHNLDFQTAAFLLDLEAIHAEIGQATEDALSRDDGSGSGPDR